MTFLRPIIFTGAQFIPQSHVKNKSLPDFLYDVSRQLLSYTDVLETRSSHYIPPREPQQFTKGPQTVIPKLHRLLFFNSVQGRCVRLGTLQHHHTPTKRMGYCFLCSSERVDTTLVTHQSNYRFTHFLVPLFLAVYEGMHLNCWTKSHYSSNLLNPSTEKPTTKYNTADNSDNP